MKTYPQLMTLALSLATAMAIAPADQAEKPVKVFILTGQSNMQGKAQNSPLEFQATDPKTKDLFAHLRKGDAWIVRDDVFIKYLDRKGGLTIGYGSPGRTGVELEQAQDKIRKQNEKNQGKQAPLPTMEDIKAPYGSSYRNMIKEVKDTFDNYETLFPALKGKPLELAGFVWFQGFNDMFGDQAPGEYAANMEHFIKDVRKDLMADK